MKKRRSGWKIMISLLNLLGNLKYIIILAVLGGYVGNACAIAVMAFGSCCVAKLIDPSFTDIPLEALAAFTIIAGVLRGLLRFLEQYNNHYIAFKLLAALRDKVFGVLRILAPAKLEGRRKGDVIAMLTADIETLEVFYAHTISPVLIAVLVDGTVVVLVSIIGNIWLGLISLLAYLIIGIAVPFISSAAVKNEGVEFRTQFANTSSYFLDSIKGIREIIQHNAKEKREQEIDRQSAFLNKKTVSIRKKSSGAGAISNLIVSLAILVILFVGTVQAASGILAVPNLVVAMVLAFSSFGPVLSLAALPSNLTQTFAAGDRILDFMTEEPEVEENRNGEDFEFENLSVKDIRFSYEDGVPAVDGVSIEVNKGDIIGVVGESGCGKSTLLKLLLRFYDPEEGNIEYNGIGLKDINAKALHRNVTMVSQDTYLFNDTIFNNLIFVKPQASLEEVRKACRLAAVDHFIMSLPDGYDSEAGLLGESLSAGERQRIGLARAFLSGAQLILLDEVTSNVDAINEGIILRSLKAAAKEHTVILVSHRESTVSICSRIYRMKNGKVLSE